MYEKTLKMDVQQQWIEVTDSHPGNPGSITVKTYISDLSCPKCIRQNSSNAHE